MLAANVPPPLPQEAAVVVIYEARAVYDTAALQFKHFAADRQPMWILAVLSPAADSGSATIPGSRMDEKTGAVAIPPGAQAALKKAGTWKAITTAAPVQKYMGGTYSWIEPTKSHQQVHTPEDYYSPFADGGTIVFRYEPAAAGIAQFDSVRLIFPDWAEHVPGASTFVQTHPGLLENGKKKATEITQLRQLLHDQNKLIVAEAFRELANSGHLDVHLAFDQLTSATPHLDSIFTYLLLTSRASDTLAEQVKAAIYASPDQRRLQLIALGAFSAMLFHAREPNILARSKTALEDVQSRLRELKISPDPNSELYLILSKSGVM